jgi:hypothetical protein
MPALDKICNWMRDVRSLMTQKCNQIGQGPGKPGLQPQILENKQSDQGRSDLRLNRIGAGSQERLDFKILLMALQSNSTAHRSW